MEYTNEQWAKIFDVVREVDPGCAILFFGSANEDHTSIEFNFVSRLENDEDTISVVENLAERVKAIGKPTHVIQHHQKPNLKVVED